MRDFNAFVREQLAGVALPDRHEQKIVEELAAQLEDTYDALIADGRSDEEAWTELRRGMPDWKTVGAELLESEPVIVRLAQPGPAGRVASMRRALGFALRELAGGGWARDLRSSLRLFLKDRAFTATAVLTLAVCLGANAAIFAIVYSVLLRPLPVPDSDRIVAMGDVYPTISPDDILSNTAPSYFDRLEAISALEEQALFSSWFDTIVIDGVAEELHGIRATPSLFRVLRVHPALGRAFTEADGRTGAEHKIILSHGLWQRLYGGDRAVIGRDLRLGWTGQRYTIVGVMPRGFSFFDRGNDGHAQRAGEEIQFWIPLAFTTAQTSYDARTRYGFFHIGRIRPGGTVEQVQAQVDALNAANFKRFPELGLAELGMYTAVTPLQHALTRSVRPVLYLLWGGAAFVLLIGALNIANLALARSTARAREVATRLALGASRFRVTRQLIAEGVLLAGIGGVASIAVAVAILRVLTSGGMASLPNAATVRVDWTVAGVVVGLSLLAGVLIGIVPAAAVSRVRLNHVLAEGSRLGTAGRATNVFRRGLVIAQIACSLVLLIGAGLLLTSFRNLLAVDAGFEADRVTTATIFPPPSRYRDEHAVVALCNRVLESIRTVPGVEAAGITSNIGMSGRTSPATVAPADRSTQPGEALVLPSVVSVTPGYFEAMGTRLVRGRYFAESDRADTLPVAIVDERLAARFWPGQDPVGKGLHRGDLTRYTVVGVVRNVRFESLSGQSDSVGAAYFPHTQSPALRRLRYVAVKTSTDVPHVVRALRSTLAAIDPDLPLADVQTMSERTARSVVPQKLATALATMFGVVALLLSVLGIYGVLAYVVAQRTREIGIRVALGSTPTDIFHMVLKEGLTLIACGLMVGLLGTLGLGRALEGHVFGVRPTDPLVVGTIAVGTAIIALLACVSPARRATRVDPLVALNEP